MNNVFVIQRIFLADEILLLTNRQDKNMFTTIIAAQKLQHFYILHYNHVNTIP